MKSAHFIHCHQSFPRTSEQVSEPVSELISPVPYASFSNSVIPFIASPSLPFNQVLTQSVWDYESGIRCDFHEEVETRFCTLGQLHRWCFAIFDAMKMPIIDEEKRRDVKAMSQTRPVSRRRGGDGGGGGVGGGMANDCCSSDVSGMILTHSLHSTCSLAPRCYFVLNCLLGRSLVRSTEVKLVSNHLFLAFPG